MSMEAFREEVIEAGERQVQLHIARKLIRKGMDLAFIQEMTELDMSTLKTLVSEQSLV